MQGGTYPNPDPVIVRLVPPPVPPLLGDTLVTVGVKEASYVYALARDLFSPLTDMETSQTWAEEKMHKNKDPLTLIHLNLTLYQMTKI